jgi:hypothetical protein
MFFNCLRDWSANNLQNLQEGIFTGLKNVERL